MTIPATEEVTQVDEDAAIAALKDQPYIVAQKANWSKMAKAFARHRVAAMLSATPPVPEVAETVGEDFLTQLRRVNADRYHAWVGDGQDAGILFDAAELGGEVGELLNVVKKLVREEGGWRGSRAAPEDFADECGDVLICLDKLARRRGVDLAEATARKFNSTSEKQGFPHKLALTPTHTVSDMGVDKPIPMLLFCPSCGIQHIDEPDERTPHWDNPPHRSHLCHACGCIWRPADVATVGVVRIATSGKADNWGKSNCTAIAALTAHKPDTQGLREALEPFARLGDLIELETEGFADTDELPLTTEDGHLLDRFSVGDFRRARTVLNQESR